jgi:hypothetical protein
MNGPARLFAQQADMMQAMVDRVNTISKKADKEDDDGTWGVDGWIRTLHNLIDLQVRMYASFVQAAITNPLWWLEPPSGDPQPSEPITVNEQPYPRSLKVIELSRLGCPTEKLQPSCVGFRPEILPAGATQFQLYLKDHNYVGANYTGKVALTKMGDPTAKPDPEPVTVGL